MTDFLFTIDVSIFFFINQTIANPIFDFFLPILTDLNKFPAVLLVLAITLGIILWKGGKTGRITVGLLVLTVIISDQFNSSLLKEIFGRVRPCRALDGVRMLVDCGGGYSFPSSHAVNNFAGASIISHFYHRQKKYWFTFAGAVAFSRTYVGVHYPSDIIAGSVIGVSIGIFIIFIWSSLNKKYQILQ